MQRTNQPPVAARGTFTIGGDLTVYRLGFGTMRLTGPGIWGPPKNKDEAIAVLRRAVELGVNLLDTADSYGPEVAESLIAEALYPYPPQLETPAPRTHRPVPVPCTRPERSIWSFGSGACRYACGGQDSPYWHLERQS